MDARQIILTLLKVKDLDNPFEDGSKWQASLHIDGKETKKRPVVKRFSCGLRGPSPWFRFDVETPDEAKTTKNMSVIGFYEMGEGDIVRTIENGVEKIRDNGDIVVSKRVKGWNGKIIGVLELKYTGATGKPVRWRFDCELWRAL